MTDSNPYQIIASGKKRQSVVSPITGEPGGFDLDRLPPDADPYPAVLTVHPRFEIDEDQGVIVEKEVPTASQLLGAEDESETVADRTEPELDVYADALSNRLHEPTGARRSQR